MTYGTSRTWRFICFHFSSIALRSGHPGGRYFSSSPPSPLQLLYNLGGVLRRPVEYDYDLRKPPPDPLQKVNKVVCREPAVLGAHAPAVHGLQPVYYRLPMRAGNGADGPLSLLGVDPSGPGVCGRDCLVLHGHCVAPLDLLRYELCQFLLELGNLLV